MRHLERYAAMKRLESTALHIRDMAKWELEHLPLAFTEEDKRGIAKEDEAVKAWLRTLCDTANLLFSHASLYARDEAQHNPDGTWDSVSFPAYKADGFPSTTEKPDA